MKKEYVILITAILFGLAINLVGATSIGTFRQDSTIQIYQTCNNCTYCNFTRVMNPSNQTILLNVIAVRDETYFYYTIDGGNSTVMGTYTYCYDCGNLVERETGCLNYNVTPNGKEDEGSGLAYVGIILFFIFMITLSIVGLLKTERIYLKLFAFYSAWILTMILFYSLWVASDNFLYSISFLAFFFKYLFIVQTILFIPLLFGSFI